MNFKGTFIPKKVLGRLGFRIALNLIRDYVNVDILADMSKLKVSLTHVIMTDIDWCILISYLAFIREEYKKNHPESYGLVRSGQISLTSMFTQVVFVSEGGEIMTSAREQGIRLPSYFMQDSRIGLFVHSVQRAAHDVSYVNIMHGCVLNERLLHDRFGHKEGISIFLFYDSYSSSMHHKMFDDMVRELKLNGGTNKHPATQPILKILSNRYVTPTRSHSKSLACYFCRDSDNLYTVDVELGDVFEEIFINAEYLKSKGSLLNINKSSPIEQEQLYLFSDIEPVRNVGTSSSIIPIQEQTMELENVNDNEFRDVNEDENSNSQFQAKQLPASLKRPVNPTTIEKVQTEPELVPKPKKKKTSAKPATLLEGITPTVLPDTL